MQRSHRIWLECCQAAKGCELLFRMRLWYREVSVHFAKPDCFMTSSLIAVGKFGERWAPSGACSRFIAIEVLPLLVWVVVDHFHIDAVSLCLLTRCLSDAFSRYEESALRFATDLNFIVYVLDLSLSFVGSWVSGAGRSFMSFENHAFFDLIEHSSMKLFYLKLSELFSCNCLSTQPGLHFFEFDNIALTRCLC